MALSICAPSARRIRKPLNHKKFSPFEISGGSYREEVEQIKKSFLGGLKLDVEPLQIGDKRWFSCFHFGIRYTDHHIILYFHDDDLEIVVLLEPQ